MHRRISLALAAFAAPLFLAACDVPPTADELEEQDLAATAAPELRAGLRASIYGIDPYPQGPWWVDSIKSMASRFPGAKGEQIAIPVEVEGELGLDQCHARFPNPDPARVWPGVIFEEADRFEESFTALDRAGVKLWLQVEPAKCDVSMLIDLVMRRYGHHRSVIGFGVDVEFLRVDLNPDGKPVTDAEARAWVKKTRSYNSKYEVFLKHWLPEHMPKKERTGLVFIDDSQEVGSMKNLVDEFAVWGKKFNPSPVGFQFGYETDQAWWKKLKNPPQEIGRAILKKIPNTRDLIWVDFTAYTIWPPKP